MHANGLGNVTQDQRAQMRHPVAKEPVLLADNFGRHLHDGGRALMQGLHQPVGSLQLFTHEAAFFAVAQTSPDFRDIFFIDQNPRQRIGIQLKMPVAIARSAHQNIGDHRCSHLAIGRAAGARIERFDLVDHVMQIIGIDTANPAQPVKFAFRQQFKIGQKGRHCRIKPV